ncbi:hypothetical protein U9M48_026195, partial [Paspalum notatum var. saurae]
MKLGSSVLAHFVLKDRLDKLGVLGCVSCIVGSVVVMHTPEEHMPDSVKEIWNLATPPGGSLHKQLLTDSILAVSTMGRVSSVCNDSNVVSIKAIGVAIKLTLDGVNQAAYPYTWLFLMVAIICGVSQINYLNKALDTFNLALVSPIYYVMFTTLTIVASGIMFKDWAGQSLSSIASELCGLITILSGTVLLHTAEKGANNSAARWVYAVIPRRMTNSLTVAEGLEDRISRRERKIRWCGSGLRMGFIAPKLPTEHCILAPSGFWITAWSSWLPLRVKIFLWLAHRRRLWTADRRRRHDLDARDLCWLCDKRPETCLHLLVDCRLMTSIWEGLPSYLDFLDATTLTLIKVCGGAECMFRQMVLLQARSATRGCSFALSVHSGGRCSPHDEGVRRPITDGPCPVLQYADDTLVIVRGDSSNVSRLEILLDSFADATGLTINYHKSTAVPMHVPSSKIGRLVGTLRCQQASFPQVYLGLPLFNVKLQLSALDCQCRSAPGWVEGNYAQSCWQNRTDGLSNHIMGVVLHPAWIVKAMDRRRRAFLSAGSQTTNGSQCLVAWTKVCLSKEEGGLVIKNLKLQNICLLLKLVVSIKAIGVAIKLTLDGVNQAAYPYIWLFLMVAIICGVSQINYLNEALDTFNLALVSPIYYDWTGQSLTLLPWPLDKGSISWCISLSSDNLLKNVEEDYFAALQSSPAP